MGTSDRIGLTVITPAFNESLYLPLFYEALKEVAAKENYDWEWIAIDDHSRDNTFEILSDLAKKDPRVKGFRLARNSGSHSAIMCGIEIASGDVVAVMASDMQDPPEFLPNLIAEWKAGSHVVWAVRAKRYGEKFTNVLFARLYYWIVRHFDGLQEMPPTGADFYIMDRRVAEALKQYQERSISLFLLVCSMGFKQSRIFYDKQARAHGQTGWSFSKKVKLISDSMIPFTSYPLRAMIWIGILFIVVGKLAALGALCGACPECAGPSSPWPAAIFVSGVMSVVGGILMIMCGMIGTLLWRVLDETRMRPRYLIEASTMPEKKA